MKLRNRLLVFHAISLVIMTIALIIVGWFGIQHVIKSQYEREMIQELNRIVLRAQRVTTTLDKWGIEDRDFLNRRQQEYVGHYAEYRYGETGGLNFVPSDPAIDVSRVNLLDIHDTVIKQMRNRKSGYMWLESGGDTYYVAYKSYEPWDWVVLLSISREEMFAYRSSFFLLVTLIAASVMMITLTIGAFLIGQLVRRFDEMLSSVHKIEEGDFSPRIENFDTAPEILKLQHGINAMAESLRERTLARDNAEKALKGSQEKYRQLIETSNDVIYLMENNKFEIVNRKFTEVTGYTKEEACDPNFNFMKMIAPSSLKVMEERRKRVLLGMPVSRTYPMTAISKDGREIDFDVSVTYQDTGEGVSVQAILRDVTQRNISEQQNRQRQKMEAIGTLAGGIAHDFNNILSVILGYADLLKMEIGHDPENQESLKEIINAATKARDLVNQIISFTRRSDREFKPVYVYDVVTDAMSLIKSLIPENVRVVVDLESKSPVLADTSNIHQIMLNLCLNAAFAMENSGGLLTIRLHEIGFNDIPGVVREKLDVGDHIRIEVEDTGHGISPEILSRIFDPYFSTKPKDQGSGLGLAIVQGIVSTLNGAIEVTSEVGTGTKFTVYLPVVKKEGALEGRYVEEEKLSEAPIRIMYVDDESSIVMMIKKALATFGYIVSGYSNSKKALQAIIENPDQFDLVISDLSMPEVTGLDIARKAHELRPDLPIMICTGFHERGEELDVGKNGIRTVITKPLSLRDLVAKIEEVFAPVSRIDAEET